MRTAAVRVGRREMRVREREREMVGRCIAMRGCRVGSSEQSR